MGQSSAESLHEVLQALPATRRPPWPTERITERAAAPPTHASAVKGPGVAEYAGKRSCGEGVNGMNAQRCAALVDASPLSCQVARRRRLLCLELERKASSAAWRRDSEGAECVRGLASIGMNHVKSLLTPRAGQRARYGAMEVGADDRVAISHSETSRYEHLCTASAGRNWFARDGRGGREYENSTGRERRTK